MKVEHVTSSPKTKEKQKGPCAYTAYTAYTLLIYATRSDGIPYLKSLYQNYAQICGKILQNALLTPLVQPLRCNSVIGEKAFQ